jgi:hypothetical protein
MLIFRTLTGLALAAGLSVPGPVQADTELRDRYVAASQQMGENMLKVIEDCAPGLDTSGIDFEHTPRMMEAVGCVIDTHIERFGRDETEALVAEAEAMGERSFSSLQEMGTMQQDYPRLSSPGMVEITQQCGVVEASQDLPISRLMQDNMGELMACFSQ